MVSTVTSQGQITIPEGIRDRLGLKAGDQLEFDESAPVLVARKVAEPVGWEVALTEWREASTKCLGADPWNGKTAMEILDELRGGKPDSTRP